jgi:hypothetical protein
MSEEKKKLLQLMKGHIGGNASNQFPHMAEFLNILVEDMDKQTKRIIFLTWVLLVATVGLLFFAVIQTVILEQDYSAHKIPELVSPNH